MHVVMHDVSMCADLMGFGDIPLLGWLLIRLWSNALGQVLVLSLLETRRLRRLLGGVCIRLVFCCSVSNLHLVSVASDFQGIRNFSYGLRI